MDRCAIFLRRVAHRRAGRGWSPAHAKAAVLFLRDLVGALMVHAVSGESQVARTAFPERTRACWSLLWLAGKPGPPEAARVGVTVCGAAQDESRSVDGDEGPYGGGGDVPGPCIAHVLRNCSMVLACVETSMRSSAISCCWRAMISPCSKEDGGAVGVVSIMALATGGSSS